MAACPKCKTQLKFSDVLKSATPWSIKCSGCGEGIRSGMAITIVALLLFAGLCLGLFSLCMSWGLGLISTLIVLMVVAGGMEYLWYCLLDKGVIKSNLLSSQD